jgi:hypothetical protein
VKLAVVLPSRGLVFSETIAEVIREVRALGRGWEWDLFWAHSRPIPECFNEPSREALAWGATHVWLVEEDMALPPGILRELMDAGKPIVAADYPIDDKGHLCVNRDRSGNVRHSGTGCVFAEAEAYRASLPFTTEWCWVVNPGTDKWTRARIPPAMEATKYGMHDIEWGMRLLEKGQPIHIIDTVVTQRRVVREAAHHKNALGWHEIVTLPIPNPQPPR